MGLDLSGFGRSGFITMNGSKGLKFLFGAAVRMFILIELCLWLVAISGR